jgi:Uma2 family endonuclease
MLAAESQLEPRTRLWSKSEFFQMAELGWFEGQRAELVAGEIVVLSPQKFLHASTTDRATEVARAMFGQGYWVRMQLPLDTGKASLPEPDVSVVRGRREDYRDHPTEAVLVIEVSDTTLAFDRDTKSLDYAAAGIRDYWVVNLIDRQLEVYREPIRDPFSASGWRYAQISVLSFIERVSPLARPDQSIGVAEIIQW